MFAQITIMADNYSYTNMSGASFGSQDSSVSNYGQETNFEVSDFLNDWFEEDVPGFSSFSQGYNSPQHMSYMPNEVDVSHGGISNNSFCTQGTADRDGVNGKEKMRDKVAFKTMSEVEILDDGFKWRKYGKKMVKNSPNPRNYYRCSVEGCSVKKRVERDKEDHRYVVTTYEGIHNHEGPTK